MKIIDTFLARFAWHRPAGRQRPRPGTATPYKVLDTTQLMGNGGIDYVYADNDGRRVYVPRGGTTFVFDLDSHKYIGCHHQHRRPRRGH